MSFGSVSKSLFVSKTFWTCIIGAIAEGLTAAGVHILDDAGTQAELVGLIMGGLAVLFRHTATQPTHITAPLLLLCAGLGLSACAGLPQQAPTAAIAAFEQTAGPQIAQACDVFHQAEANPLVQLAVAGGAIATDAAVTKGAASAGVALVKSYGSIFCQDGPPPGDTTSPAQQAVWLADIAAKMLAAAGAH